MNIQNSIDALFAENRLIRPDYNNCIANLPNSIFRKYGLDTVGNTLPLIDKYLEKDHKNVVLLLLDGMGIKIMERHLKENGAFYSHLTGVYNSVFLSTTTAATTSVMSGLQPCEHCWLGWDCYYPSIDKNVTLFLNQEQLTEKPAADYNVAGTVTPYDNIVDRLNRAGKKAYLIAPFANRELASIDDICREIRLRCDESGSKYIYAYWNQPDGLLHRNGGGTQIVLDAMAHMEEVVSGLAEELEDTLFIITADHGHIDTESVMFKDYPQLCECLVHWPSLEPRALNFFVKEDKKEFFVSEFNRLFGDRFILMPMEEVIERKLMGTQTPHKEFRGMLGDYLAIATSDLSIYFTEECWLSMHGSLTEDEMLIPLIVFSNDRVVE
ncbi:MAG: phosphodiesterase [Lachnospiraceae bacterium]|nr:phosphodiesterase [Lachnospiraceae bacterium]